MNVALFPSTTIADVLRTISTATNGAAHKGSVKLRLAADLSSFVLVVVAVSMIAGVALIAKG